MVEAVGAGISHIFVAHPVGGFAEKTLLFSLTSLELLKFFLQSFVLTLSQ